LKTSAQAQTLARQQTDLFGVMFCSVAFMPESTSATPPQALGLAMLVPALVHKYLGAEVRLVRTLGHAPASSIRCFGLSRD